MDQCHPTIENKRPAANEPSARAFKSAFICATPNAPNATANELVKNDTSHT